MILVLVSISAFAQISFEKGYFIDNNHHRIECLIKNMDWKNNPAEFEYKLLTDSVVTKGNLGTVKEFGVAGFSRYVNADTKIDLSPAEIDNFYTKRDPEWSPVHLFLKVLVEGKATLYVYTSGKTTRFFYSVSDSPINQLICKEYYVSNEQIAENMKFREQLWTDVRLVNAGMNSIENMGYYESDLVRYFKKYNAGEGKTTVVFEQKTKKESFHLKISPGISYTSLAVSNTLYEYYNIDFGNRVNFRLGAEAEFIMPFNRNKWSLTIEPTFEYFNAEKVKSNAIVTMHFNAIEFPVGLRHYFFLNKDVKLFADAMFIPAISIGINSTFVYKNTVSSILPTVYNLKIGQSYALGGGIGYKKYSAEMRYYSNQDLFNGYGYWFTDYPRFSLILGYRIL